MSVYHEHIAAAIKPDSRVLDLGCGDGRFSGIQITGFHGKELVGLDIDGELLKKNTYVHYRVLGNAQILPFADGIFDVVITRALVEHLTAPRSAFSEISRVLKSGGKVVLMTPNKLNPLGFFSSNISAKTRATLKKTFTRPELLEGNYEAYYRCNSGGKISRAFRRLGVSTEKVAYEDIGLNWLKRPIIKFFFNAFQKITNIGFLNRFKFEVFFVGVKK